MIDIIRKGIILVLEPSNHKVLNFDYRIIDSGRKKYRYLLFEF